MTLPAQFQKRLEALEKHYARDLGATLLVTDKTARCWLKGVDFRIERGSDESLKDFQTRALRGAKAQFPRAEILPLLKLTEADRNLL